MQVRLNEVFCKADESSRDTRTVLQQAIASSVANARSRGEPHIPEPSNPQVAEESDSEDDVLDSQGIDKGRESESEQQERREEL